MFSLESLKNMLFSKQKQGVSSLPTVEYKIMTPLT